MSSPTPIILRPIINVPPPTVIQPPENVWTTWLFPGATLVAALVAALVSIILWRKAKEQIDLATKALKTAQDELELVKTDLEFSKQQVAYLNRKALLSLKFDSGFEEMNYTQTMQGGGHRWVDVRLFVHNEGTRTARDATLILFVPEECRPDTWYGQAMPNPEEWYKRNLYRFEKNLEINKRRYDRILHQVAMPVYPGLPNQVFDLRLVPPGTGEWSSELLWQIVYDDGKSPEGTPFGILRYKVLS